MKKEKPQEKFLFETYEDYRDCFMRWVHTLEKDELLEFIHIWLRSVEASNDPMAVTTELAMLELEDIYEKTKHRLPEKDRLLSF